MAHGKLCEVFPPRINILFNYDCREQQIDTNFHFLANALFTLLRFCTKRRSKLHFCETVYTTQHKNTKMEVYKYALQSGYLHKRRLENTQEISVNA